MRRKGWVVFLASAVVVGLVSVSVAALLGVMPGFPLLSYDATGVTAYNAGSQSFNIEASPIAIRFTPTSVPRMVTPTGSPPSEVLRISIKVDASGNVISGVPGDDLVIEGEIDADGNGTPDYAGILLTGEIVEFGFEDSGGPTDQYDFRFKVTGGALASFYTGMDIAVTTVSESSTFTGDFTVNFAGGAKGNVGPIPRLNRPPVCNANGPYMAECEGAQTVILLDGTQSIDEDDDELEFFWSTDCPGAVFDDPTSDSPVLTIDTGGVCDLVCEVTLIVSDGIATPEECKAAVVISDTNTPDLQCPGDVTVQCDSSTDPSVTGTATAEDDCDPNVTVSYEDLVIGGACPQSWTIERTWTASDSCGNSTFCVQTITVVDETAPEITECPAEISVGCEDGTHPDVTGRPVATDNCDPSPSASFEDEIVEGTCPVSAVISRMWTVADACGNATTCVQTINVLNTTAPSIDCVPDVTVQCGESLDPSHTGSASARDGCDANPAVTFSDEVIGACPTVILRTWRATDACGEFATCVQTITVEDTTPPEITCPQDATISCGHSTDPSNTGLATAVDNCDPNPFVSFEDAISGSCPGTITRVWTAVDLCENAVSCAQIITVTTAAPCPRTPGFWKNHRNRWPVDSMVIGGVLYNDVALMHLLSNRNPDGSKAGSDATSRLAQFVVATRFNLFSGSDPDDIESTLGAADAFLAIHPPGSNPKGADRNTANSLKDVLDAYCNSSPPGCTEGN